MQSNTFTLSGATIRLAREALYSELGPSLDVMDSALVSQGREESCATHAAYRKLTAVGALLDKIGWIERDEKPPLTIGTPAEARLLVDALSVELEEERERVRQARQFDEPEYARKCKANRKLLRKTLRAVECDASAAGLLDAEARDA